MDRSFSAVFNFLSINHTEDEMIAKDERYAAIASRGYNLGLRFEPCEAGVTICFDGVGVCFARTIGEIEAYVLRFDSRWQDA